MRSRAPSRPPVTRTLLGWREWVALPDLGIARIKVKTDTGARTSALHAWNLSQFERDGAPWVRFIVHPMQRLLLPAVEVEALQVDERPVRNSGGVMERRPVILTHLAVLGHTFPIEVTLTPRDEMGFRMLLGREALRDRFLVDPTKSYYNGRLGRQSRLDRDGHIDRHGHPNPRPKHPKVIVL